MAKLDQFLQGGSDDQVIPATWSAHALRPWRCGQTDERDMLPLRAVHPIVVQLEHDMAFIDDDQISLGGLSPRQGLN